MRLNFLKRPLNRVLLDTLTDTLVLLEQIATIQKMHSEVLLDIAERLVDAERYLGELNSKIFRIQNPGVGLAHEQWRH